MKQLAYAFLSTVFVLTAASCGSDNNPEDPGHHRTPQDGDNRKYTVSLSLGGDYVQTEEEPLSRADGEKKTYVGINVTRLEKGVSGAQPKKFACGVFEGKDNIYIELYGGYTYEFEATAMIDATDCYYVRNGYNAPFKYRTAGDSNSFSYRTDWLQAFHYTFDAKTYQTEKTKEYLSQLKSGSAYVAADDPRDPALTEAEFSYPRVHRYYGVAENFDPSVSSTVNIDMAYCSFGLKVVIDNMPQGTTLTWEDVTDDKGLQQKDKQEYLQFPKSLVLSTGAGGLREWEDIYSLNKLTSADMKELTLKFTWTRGDGSFETFPAKISVRPNLKKILRINIEGSSNTETRHNIVLKLQDEPMEEDTSNIDKDLG